MLSYLEVVVLAVLRHSLQVGVGVQQVLPALGDLRGYQRVQISRHNVLDCISFTLENYIYIYKLFM